MSKRSLARAARRARRAAPPREKFVAVRHIRIVQSGPNIIGSELGEVWIARARDVVPARPNRLGAPLKHGMCFVRLATPDEDAGLLRRTPHHLWGGRPVPDAPSL